MLERTLTPRQPDPQTLRNFLLLLYSDTPEDATDATPLIATLKAALPECRIAVAGHNVALEALAGHPGVDRWIVTPSPLRGVVAAARALRAARPFGREAYAVLLPVGNESPRIVLAAMLGGCPTRVGFTLAPELITIYLVYDERISLVANNLSLTAALGHSAEVLQALRADPALLEPQEPQPPAPSPSPSGHPTA